MKKNSVRVIWIDDDPEKREIAENLKAKRRELEIEFISRENQFEDFLNRSEDIDLFLVDDQLIIRSQSPFNRRGLSVAAQIREKYSEIPIYLYSAVKEEPGIYATLAEAAESLADRVLELKEIQRAGHKILCFDGKDYRKIRESPRESVESLLTLLQAPTEDHDRIILALPESLKKGLSSEDRSTPAEGNTIAFAKWIRKMFLRHPGFVYDSLFAATMLGMKEAIFKTYSQQFHDAEYTGVFKATTEDLWWSTELRNIVFRTACKKYPKNDITDLKKLAPKLLGLKDSQKAKCGICGKNYPETVGTNKEDETDRRPVHYGCSSPDPRRTRVLYFEEARQFSEA